MRRINYEMPGLNYNLSKSPRHCHYHQKSLFKRKLEEVEEDLLNNSWHDLYSTLQACGDRYCEI